MRRSVVLRPGARARPGLGRSVASFAAPDRSAPRFATARRIRWATADSRRRASRPARSSSSPPPRSRPGRRPMAPASIEIWGTGFLGVPAGEGTSFAELNATTPRNALPGRRLHARRDDELDAPPPGARRHRRHAGPHRRRECRRRQRRDGLGLHLARPVGRHVGLGSPYGRLRGPGRPDLHAVRVPHGQHGLRESLGRQLPRRRQLHGLDPGPADARDPRSRLRRRTPLVADGHGPMRTRSIGLAIIALAALAGMAGLVPSLAPGRRGPPARRR